MGEQTIVPEVLLDKTIELGVSFSDSTFPIGIFPLRYETSLLTRFPYRLYCIGNAGAIAVGIANTYLVQLKRGWQESAMLYVALVGRPGTNKSHPA